jgi:hypothetical protein
VILESRRTDPPVVCAPDSLAGRSVDMRDLAVVLFKLVLAQPIGGDREVDWSALLRFATEERCAPLAWHRSGAEIRRLSSPAVAAQWRAAAVASAAYGARQLRVLVSTVRALADAATAPVILKGQPLAQRLYGIASLRGSADLDVFVAPACRLAAERALRDGGWMAIEGAAPWTQTLVLREDGSEHFLELHSSLLDVNLRHLGVPAPGAQTMSVDGIDLPAHRDAILPAYLASHAAKHMPIALLYHVDFLTLWTSLTRRERDEATEAAERAGLSGYLRWAIRCAGSVTLAADGDRTALARLGIGANGRRVYHTVFRDIALAQTPLDAGRAVGAWLWPPHLRHGIAPLARRWAARLRKPWLEYVIPTRRRRHGV